MLLFLIKTPTYVDRDIYVEGPQVYNPYLADSPMKQITDYEDAKNKDLFSKERNFLHLLRQ